MEGAFDLALAPPAEARHPLHVHTLTWQARSSWTCDVCRVLQGPEVGVARMRCSNLCDWDVCAACMHAAPFLYALELEVGTAVALATGYKEIGGGGGGPLKPGQIGEVTEIRDGINLGAGYGNIRGFNVRAPGGGTWWCVLK